MIRQYKPEDLEAIKRMHSGEYPIPDFEHPLVILKKCLVDENDIPRMAAIGRLHLDATLFVDHSWRTPEERLEALKRLHNAMFEEAGTKGVDIVIAQAEGRFADRLKDLGWTRGPGELYYHDII